MLSKSLLKLAKKNPESAIGWTIFSACTLPILPAAVASAVAVDAMAWGVGWIAGAAGKTAVEAAKRAKPFNEPKPVAPPPPPPPPPAPDPNARRLAAAEQARAAYEMDVEMAEMLPDEEERSIALAQAQAKLRQTLARLSGHR